MARKRIASVRIRRGSILDGSLVRKKDPPMPRISIRGNTLYYREPEHTEVVSVIDGQGDL